MKKKMDIKAISSELSEGSVFFPRKAEMQGSSSSPQTQEPETHPVPLVPPVRDVLPVPPKKRVMKQRHPFDIWRDQYEALQRFADEDRRNGLTGSMSAMVRDALDKLIAERTKK